MILHRTTLSRITISKGNNAHSIDFLSQDMERVNLFPIKHSDVNITSFRIVDPDSPRAREYLKDWTPEVFGRGRNHPLYVSKF